jgi:hypothetical protein
VTGPKSHDRQLRAQHSAELEQEPGGRPGLVLSWVPWTAWDIPTRLCVEVAWQWVESTDFS